MHTPNRHERRAARARARSAPPPRQHRFVVGWKEATKSKRPEAEVAILETILADTWSNESLARGDWILHATTELYLHGETPGFGPTRTLALIDRFLDFHCAKGTIGAWAHKRLRHEVVRQRIAHRLIDGPAPSEGHDECVLRHELDDLAARFAETLTHPIDRSLGASVIAMTALALRAQDGGRHTQFGSLDVSRLVNDLLLAGDPEDDEPGATPAFLRILADFYVWRGAEGRLDPARAAELATQLRATALAHGALRAGAPAH